MYVAEEAYDATKKDIVVDPGSKPQKGRHTVRREP